jgi:hypothetical protein
MAEASGVVELDDEEVLQKNEAANIVRETRSDLNVW